MRKSRIGADVAASAIGKVTQLSRVTVGSEDDLIHKVVLPFFEIIGYGSGSFELKFPVQGYRPNRPGRKPEADCAFFSGTIHDHNSSLLVAEIKRDEPGYPEQQARFYATNLFVPFYVPWNDFAFEVWQVQNYRPPLLLGRYQLRDIDRTALSELQELLAPDRIIEFCEKNHIKQFDFDDRRKTIEARYLERLATDLRTFKVLDLPGIRDLDSHYVELRLREIDVVPLRTVGDQIERGIHPEIIEPVKSSGRTFGVSDLLGKTSAIALIGDPGAGKTTLLRRLSLDNAYADSRSLPIFISIRELVATGATLIEAALHQVGRYSNTDNPEFVFDTALAQGRLLLCVDGIDELDMDEPRDARAAVIRFNADLSDILSRHIGNTIVVTARRESWSICRPLLSQSLREFAVAPFARSAVRKFVSQWFRESPEDGERIIDALRVRGWPSFAMNPLLLTLTCACIPLQGELPERASDLYARFLSFMLEQWDISRRISDGRPVPGIDPEITFQLLAELALTFHSQRRAAFTRREVTQELANHLSLLRSPASTPRDVFLEITRQHGMLRSWSIDQHYAFPHLSFQAYLAARAVRSRADGHRIIVEHRHDPFWREAVILYAELGDITNLARELLATTDNILASNLLLLADCWAVGGVISDLQLSSVTIDRLLTLAKGDNAFLADHAAIVLARIAVPEARTAFAKMIRDSDGKFSEDAAGRFAISILGASVLSEVTVQLMRTARNENLLENFASLPRRVAVEQLQSLILRTDWPTEEDLGYDPGIRFIRRDAERLMARVGEDIAIIPLMRLMSAPQLSNHEKEGCVSALATIDDPSVPGILREIVGGSFPMDCRIEAARNLGSEESDARRLLLQVVADEGEDYYDRRDAARVLGDFCLTDDDLPAFQSLIFDPAPEFIGGPSVAVSAVAKIATSASRSVLRNALKFWEESAHPEARRVRDSIMQVLHLEDESADLRSILEKAGSDRWINIELPQVASEYFRRNPDQANELFVTALGSYNAEVVYGGTLAWAVLDILPQIPLADSLLEAAIDLARRRPRDTSSWETLAAVWQRRDLSLAQRALFQRNSA